MTTKQYLKDLIASNKIEKAIEELIKLKEIDDKIKNDIIFQSARFKEYKESFLNSTESNENLEIKINKIKLSLLDIINRLSQNELIRTQSTFSFNPHKKLSLFNVLIFISSLLLLIFLSVVVFIPCPSQTQYTFMRIVLALLLSTAGGLVSLLDIKQKGILALFSSFLIFIIIYFYNPAKQIVYNNCNDEPFEYTIHVRPTINNNLYPKLENAILKIRLENKFESSIIDENGDADYKSIPYKFRNKKIALKLEAVHWKLETDSINLINKSNSINIVSDKSLSTIQGKVMEMTNGSIIQNATIETHGIIVKSDSNGIFLIDVPLPKQRVEYNINASKEGYDNFSGTATPETNEPLLILLSKSN